MFVLGLTGGVGTGKSTVAQMFERLGAVVLDADKIAHSVMAQGTPVWKQLKKQFGEDILLDSGEINRPQLGQIVFNNPQALKALGALVHPAVRKKVRQSLKEIRQQNPKAFVILDVPLLFESGQAYPCDAVLVVSASQKVANARLKKRNQWSLKEIQRRRSSQWPLKKKEALADFVIRNSGPRAQTLKQVKAVWKQIQHLVH